jgi:hypothetical protein
VSGELNLKHTERAETILALIFGQDRSLRWNGAELSPIGNMRDANWTEGMVAMTEAKTLDNTPTKHYVGDFPTGITMRGEYVVEYYLATDAGPGGRAIGVQDVWWDGIRMISPADSVPQSGDSFNRLGLPTGPSVSADISAVKSKTDLLPVEPAAVGSTMTLPAAERAAIAAALLDLAGAVDGRTPRQTLQIIAAVLAGKVAGAGSGTETFRSLDDQHDRVVVTADASGNRTNVTYPQT